MGWGWITGQERRTGQQTCKYMTMCVTAGKMCSEMLLLGCKVCVFAGVSAVDCRVKSVDKCKTLPLLLISDLLNTFSVFAKVSTWKSCQHTHAHTLLHAELMSDVELCTPELFPSFITRPQQSRQQKELKLSSLLLFLLLFSVPFLLSYSQRSRGGDRAWSTLWQPRETRPTSHSARVDKHSALPK